MRWNETNHVALVSVRIRGWSNGMIQFSDSSATSGAWNLLKVLTLIGSLQREGEQWKKQRVEVLKVPYFTHF